MIIKYHDLKIKKEYFQAIIDNKKSFELRKNDRDYKIGDYIKFKVINDTGEIIFISPDYWYITYILKDVPEYGLMDGYCILGIKKRS